MAGGIVPPAEVYIQWLARANYNNPHHRPWILGVLSIVLVCISFLAVSARLYARLVRLRNAGIDDLVIIIAMIPTIGLAVTIAMAPGYGFDRHAWDVRPERVVGSRKLTMAIEAFYMGSTALTKISILLFYRRLSEGSSTRTIRWIMRCCIFSVVAYIVTFTNTLLFGCHPLSAYWKQVDFDWAALHYGGRGYKCLPEGRIILVATSVSIVQDFITCVMPMAMCWNLKLKRRQRIALSMVFGVGYFLCIVGIIRIIYVAIIYYATYDVTWYAHYVYAWTAVEANLGIVCASAPALHAFFKGLMKIDEGSARYASWPLGQKKVTEDLDLSTLGNSQLNTKTGVTHTVVPNEPHWPLSEDIMLATYNDPSEQDRRARQEQQEQEVEAGIIIPPTRHITTKESIEPLWTVREGD